MQFSSKILKTIAILALAIFLVGLYFALGNRPDIENLFNPPSYAFTIPDVPRHTVFSRSRVEGQEYRVYLGPMSAAVGSLLEYWGVDTSSVVPELGIPKPEKKFFLSDIYSYLSKFSGYTVKTELVDLDELDVYLNPNQPIPLLFQIPLTADGYTVPSTAVVVGVDEKKQVLIVHNYWLGDFESITFQQLRDAHYIDDENKGIFLVFRPSEAFTPRHPVITFAEEGNRSRKQQAKDVLLLYAVGFAIQSNNPKSPSALKLLQKALNHAEFNNLHPIMRIAILDLTARSYMAIDDTNSARKYALQQQSLNHDLSASEGPWPGNTKGLNISPLPEILFGDLLYQEKDYAEAATHYKKAAAISPNYPAIIDRQARFK